MFDPNDYFKTIAETHNKLLHTDDNPAYFREFTSQSVMLNNSDFLLKMRNAKEVCIVSIFNGEKTFADNIDNNSRTYVGSVFLMKRVKSVSEINAARIELETIWEDIFAKLKKDIREGVVVIGHISAQQTPIGYIGDNYYSIAIFLSYSETFCHSYNPAMWTS